MFICVKCHDKPRVLKQPTEAVTDDFKKATVIALPPRCRAFHWSRSYGPCEICRKTAECYDCHS